MANVTMTHTAVNGGTAVNLHGVGVSYAWKNISKTDPIPGKYGIVEADYAGFSNPIIKVQGSFDIEDDQEANEITQTLLVNFATLRHITPITLSVPTGNSPVYLLGRPTEGYETDGAQTLLNTISVLIDSFDIDISTDSESGRFWNYSITFKEVT